MPTIRIFLNSNSSLTVPWILCFLPGFWFCCGDRRNWVGVWDTYETRKRQSGKCNVCITTWYALDSFCVCYIPQPCPNSQLANQKPCHWPDIWPDLMVYFGRISGSLRLTICILARLRLFYEAWLDQTRLICRLRVTKIKGTIRCNDRVKCVFLSFFFFSRNSTLW